jgi:hypothetical protein
MFVPLISQNFHGIEYATSASGRKVKLLVAPNSSAVKVSKNATDATQAFSARHPWFHRLI